MKLQRLGGYASIVLGAVTIGTIGSLVAIALRTNSTGIIPDFFYNPVQMTKASQTSPLPFLAYCVLWGSTGVLMPLIAIALQERMQKDTPPLMRLVVIAASIYAALTLTAEMSGIYGNCILMSIGDPSALRAFLVLHECLSAAAANAWGWGMLLVAWTVLRSRTFPKMLGYIMIAYGILSIGLFVFQVLHVELTVFPVWRILGLAVYLWLGIILLRKQDPSLVK